MGRKASQKRSIIPTVIKITQSAPYRGTKRKRCLLWEENGWPQKESLGGSSKSRKNLRGSETEVIEAARR